MVLIYCIERIKSKSLSQSGLVHAAALGTGLMTFMGWKGYSLWLTFLCIGIFCNKIKNKTEKM